MIKACIFDLDGTLLDSTYVWAKVDEEFFMKRSIDMPLDYGAAISGMSFEATAVYTKQRFELPESPMEIMQEWMQIAYEEYAHNIKLKDGTLSALSNLARQGVRMCVVTSNRPELIMPCLKRNGIEHMFEFILTTGEAGADSKEDGAVFALAAEKLGLRHDDCGVFDDTRTAIIGAKKQGMKAYCIIDPISTIDVPGVKALADSCATTITELLL